MFRFMGPATMTAGHAVVGSAIAYYDATAKSVSATCWESSKKFHASAANLVASTLGVGEAEANASSYQTLISRLGDACEQDARVRNQVSSLGDEIERDTRLIFYATACPTESAETTSPPSRTLDVVVPFRCRGPDESRLKNLLGILRALKTQDLHRNKYRIIVVEQDDLPRHEHRLVALCDTYVHQPFGGPFSRARALNCGVAAGDGGTLCLLDGDILPDRHFLGRCLSQIDTEQPAILPYTDMFCLDEESSRAALGGALSPGDPVCGYLIRHPPGACLWVTREAFLRAGQFDERFVGWGGEDREFYNRLASIVTIARHDDLLVHLLHDRPPMNGNRSEILAVAGATV